LSALEKWQVDMNQFAIVDHRETLELPAMEEHRFRQLGLEIHQYGLGRIPPENHRAAPEQTPDKAHSKRLVLSALENWREKLNQVAIENHRHRF